MFTCPHCKEDFDVESVNQVAIYNSKIPLFSIKCTNCNKNTKKNKNDSQIIMDKFPELQKEVEQKIASDALDISDDGKSNIVVDFEEKFRDQLSIFGMNTNKNEAKIKAVLKLIERTGATRDWLKYHMQKVNFGNKSVIESVVDLVFLDENDQGPPIPPYPSQGGYNMQTLPGGQVMLVPPYQQQYIPQPAAPPQPQPIIIDRGSGDDEIIEEELGADGTVVKRKIIKGKRKNISVEKNDDGFLKMLTMMRDLGLLKMNDDAKNQPSDEIRETLQQLRDGIVGLGSAMKSDNNRSMGTSSELKIITDGINKLSDKIAEMEKEKLSAKNDEMREHLTRIENELRSVRDGRNSYDKPIHGLSDTQFEIDTKHRNLITMSDGFDRMSDRVVTPLNKLLDSQSKLNAVILLRDLEKQDNVAPGTYMKILQPQHQGTGEIDVKATVEKWKNRASASTTPQVVK